MLEIGDVEWLRTGGGGRGGHIPEMKSQVIMPKEPRIREGRRPHLSRKTMAGRVNTTLITYWMDAVASGEAICAPSIM